MTSSEETASRRKSDREYESINSPATISYTAEALRLAAAGATPAKAEEKISLFWRLFGGTILSITALVCIQAYQAIQSGINELRADQNRMRDAAADFVKKDEFSSRSTSLWNRVQDLQSLSANVTVIGNRISAIESQNAAADRDRKDLATTVQQLQSLRDKYGTVDELKKQFDGDHKELLAIIAAQQLLREKDAALERKLTEAELERKDLLKEIQGLRERIAKLEGQAQPNSGGKQASESGR